MKKLIELLNLIELMSQALESHILSFVWKRKFPRGHLIAQPGSAFEEVNFIVKGMIRAYYYVDGREVTDYYMQEGQLFVSVISFFRGTEATEYIVCHEDCEIIGFHRQDLLDTCKLFPEFWKHFAIITGEYYCLSSERSYMIKRADPASKFNMFMKMHPGLIERTTNGQIASYLDMGATTYRETKKAYFKGL